MSFTMAVFVASLNKVLEKLPATYRTDQLLIRGSEAEQVALRVSEELPCVAVAPLAAVYAHGTPVRARFGSDQPSSPRREWIACGDEELLRALDVESGLAAFRAGRLLALRWPNDPETARAPLQLTSWIGDRLLESPQVEQVRVSQTVIEPLFLISSTRLEPMGFEPGPPLNAALTPWLIRLEVPVTNESLEQARDIAAAAVGTFADAALLHRPPVRKAYWSVLLVCVLTGTVVVLVATALSAAESVADRDILQSVGASPMLIRSHLAARAGYLAMLGCVLAVPAGIFPALGLFKMSNLPLEFVMPWRDMLLTVLLLPLVVYLITWCFGCARPPRRTMD